MKNKFTSYGVEYNFGSDKNGHIKCLDWFLPRFKSEEWEPETFELFNYVKDSERAAVDIGAWIGPTTIWLSNNFKHVISIEPDVVAFDALQENLKYSNCNNVYTINSPCYNKEVDVIFGTNDFNKAFEAEGLGSSTSRIKISNNNLEDRLQKAITLQYLKKYNFFNDISFIKVDIEGGEENILLDLFEMGQKNNWKLYVSFHYDWWAQKDIFRFKEIFNMAKKRIINMSEKTCMPVDDLISYIILNPFCSVYFDFE
jgi:FkbM family methyltransferase